MHKRIAAAVLVGLAVVIFDGVASVAIEASDRTMNMKSSTPQVTPSSNMATPDIIKKILDDAKIPADTYKLDCKETYQPRDYCVQYRETDFNFISRPSGLMDCMRCAR